MPQASLMFFESAKTDLLRGRLAFDGIPMTAVLVPPGYDPDLTDHSVFDDLGFGKDAPAHAVLVTGQAVIQDSFKTDSLHFGDPITTGPVRYVAFVEATPQSLSADKRLIFLLDLTQGETIYEAQQGAFEIKAPAGGWFTLEASQG